MWDVMVVSGDCEAIVVMIQQRRQFSLSMCTLFKTIEIIKNTYNNAFQKLFTLMMVGCMYRRAWDAYKTSI